MRKIIFFLLIVLTAAGSCSKFLDRPPQGQLSKEEVFATDSNIVALANGIYTYLGDGTFLGGRVQGLSDMLADQLDGSKLTGDFSEIYKRQNSIFGGTRDDMYKKGYLGVITANYILENIGSVSSEHQAYLKGESLFFRGMIHFELVRLFAQPWGYSSDNSQPGIPLRLSSSTASIGRSTVKEVYDQVIADLKSADSLLPDDAGDGGKFYTATKWIAEAYLAKVYFQQNDFANAFAYADAVIKSGKFQLDADYASRFSLGLTKEAILRLPNDVGHFQPGGEYISNWRSDTKAPTLYFTSQYYSYATGDPADKRVAWYSNSLQAGYNSLTKFNFNYMEEPITHITEIYLIRAEAGAELGGGSLATSITDINLILTRAYGGTSRNLSAGSTAAAVITAARTQRELEMVGEGNRLQEIKRIGARSGANIDRRGSPWNCNGLILQFPKAEQDANAAFQLNPEGGCF
ncbi:MAG TPA: RagB/SusD family nutrient uptake outer membrane protein [Puia sp.]|nr:RagB/SusD family nutrient uptake outer membrane protein [Puia sp.]